MFKRSLIATQFQDATPRKYFRRQRFLRRMEHKHRQKELRLYYNS